MKIPGHHFSPIVLGFGIVYAAGFWRILTTSGRAGDTALGDGGGDGKETEGENGNVATNGKAKEEIDEEDEKIGREEWDARSSEPDPIEESTSSALKNVANGLPTPSSKAWTILAASINLLLVLMTADMVFSAPLFYSSHSLSFSRVGYVSPTSAKIMIREPDSQQLPIFLWYRKSFSSALSSSTAREPSWKLVDKLYCLSDSTDYTHTFTIQNLRPATDYVYSTSASHSGTFQTAPSTSANPFTFLASSCLKPRVPYTALTHPLSIPGLHHLASLLPKVKPSFLLFLGDFIYIDVPLRLGSSIQTYRAEYRRIYASPSFLPSLRSVPWLHVQDDHEIANDWDAGYADPYPAARDPYEHYHLAPNPPPYPTANSTSHAFVHGPAAFFLLDTRTFRDPSTGATALPATHPHKTLLGAAQRAALLAWIAAPPSPEGVRWRFVVSSVRRSRATGVSMRRTRGLGI